MVLNSCQNRQKFMIIPFHGQQQSVFDDLKITKKISSNESSSSLSPYQANNASQQRVVESQTLGAPQVCQEHRARGESV